MTDGGVADRIRLVPGDITRQEVDAIVNAANSSLLGGGGVDGAIHHAAGPALLEACRRIGGCPTGEVRLTPGFRLPARWVIHAVGPIWRGGRSGEADLLASCYRNALTVADDPELGIATIAFPSISTGAYGYPVREAARVALEEIGRLLQAGHPAREVRFVLRGEETMAAYQDALEALRETQSDTSGGPS